MGTKTPEKALGGVRMHLESSAPSMQGQGQRERGEGITPGRDASEANRKEGGTGTVFCGKVQFDSQLDSAQGRKSLASSTW